MKENNIQEFILKARILLAYTLNESKEYLVTHDDKEVSEEDINKYNKYIKRLINGEPLQYITQEQEFMGLRFKVNKDVLIPRPDTEVLVEEVINLCGEYDLQSNINILDLCTGSGAIGISIVKNIKNSKMTLADISQKALEIAKQNCIHNFKGIEKSDNNKIEIIKSDLFSKLNKQKKFDIIVSNPPYIETQIIQKLDEEVKKEPIIALDGGEDGLEFYRKIIGEAYEFLNKDGYLCLEIGYNQKQTVIEIIENSKNYKNIYSKKDLAENDRIVVCKKV